MKFFLKLTGAAIAMVVATILIGPSFINWNRYKSEITEPIQKLTGRKLEIAGDVSFSILPAPVFSAQGLEFENIEGGRAPAFARVKSLEINVALLPLLGGRVDVTSITLNEPTIALEVLSDGRQNWTFARPGQKDPKDVPGTQQDDGAPIDISFSEVAIRGGTVSFYQAATDVSQHLDDIDATVSATTLDGPFAAKGEVVFNQAPMSFEVLIGNLKSGRAVPVSFSLGLGEAGAKMAFAGWANEASIDARINGRLTVVGENLASAIDDIAGAAGQKGVSPAKGIDPLRSPFSGEAQVVTSPNELRVRNISLMLGESVATGAFQATFDDGKLFEGSLDVASIDLDSWLSGWLHAGSESGGEPEKASLAEPKIEAKAGGAGFNIPKDLSGIFKLSVGAINYRGGVARQIGVALRLGDGRVGIENASALLPGGSAIELTGVLAPENGAPRFNGQLTASSDNLRSLLSWLDVKVDAVPVDRLTRLSYSSSLDITPGAVQIYGADIALDTLHATGGVSIALQKRLAFGVDIAMDNLNLDTYLEASKGAVVAVKPKVEDKSLLAELKQSLAVLDDIDANFKIMIGRLVWAGKDVEKLSLEGSLFAGELTLNAASIGNYLGTSGTLAGTARGFSRKPEGDLRLDFEFRDSAALGRFAGQELPYPVSRLGAGKGVLEFKGNEDRVTLGLDSVFSGTKLQIHGGIVAPSALPALDLTVAMHNGSFASLLKQFDLPLDRPKGKDDGPVAVSLSANGKLNDVKLRTTVEVGGGKLTVDGAVESVFIDPDYRFDAQLTGGDVKKLLRGLGMDFRPAAPNLGAFDVALAITGDHTKASLSGFKGNFGPVTFEGDATARLTGDRPRFEGSLKTTEVVVDLFLPPPTTGLKRQGGNVGSKPDQRWSREKIDLSYLRDFDGELKVESSGVTVGPYDFRDVRAVLAVDGGVATLKPLSARLFDGEAELSMTIDGREVPALGLQLALTNVDVAKAMTAAAGIDVLTGRAGFSGEFQTAGRSQYQMITALGGGARISAREGLIRGIDLRRMNDQLQNIGKISDVLGVVAGSLSGGQTAYHSVEGVIQVEKGIARATDVRTDIDAVDTTVTSEMDLANWTMDTKARFQLTDHPKAPPLGIDLRGPIDNPDRSLKTRQLEGYLTKLIGTAVLDKLIKPKSAAPQSQPGAAAPSQADPGPTPAVPRPLSPEDLLKGILENLP